MKRAEGVFRTGWFEMFGFDPSPCLSLDPTNDLRDGNAVLVPGASRGVPAKIAHRLEMNPPDPGNMLNGKVDDGSDLVDIDSRNQRRHQDDTQVVFDTVLYRELLLPAERTSSQFFVDFVLETIKLQKHASKAGLSEPLRIEGFSRQPQAVGVELDKPKPHSDSKGYDFREVVAKGRLAPRKLDIEGAPCREKRIVHTSDVVHAGIAAGPAASVGKAE